MKKTSIMPIPVNKALKSLGQHIKEARIKRRLTLELVAERAGISYLSLFNAEKGSATVSIGIYAKVLFVLGLVDNLYEIANPDKDEVGKILENESLPKRVRYKKKKVSE